VSTGDQAVRTTRGLCISKIITWSRLCWEKQSQTGAPISRPSRNFNFSRLLVAWCLLQDLPTRLVHAQALRALSSLWVCTLQNASSFILAKGPDGSRNYPHPRHSMQGCVVSTAVNMQDEARCWFLCRVSSPMDDGVARWAQRQQQQQQQKK
jgi:hypothetical protein